MLSIDEAIAREKQQAKEQRSHVGTWNDEYSKKCKLYAEYHEQIAEWLEELKCYKNDNDFSDCADRIHKIAFNSGYNKALDDFVEKINYTAYTSVCVDCMTKNQIIELAEQLKEGV